MADKEVAVNRRAFHDYFVDEHYEAGIVLTGTEVKSLRAGKIQLRDGFVRIDGHEAWLENVHISPYTQGGYVNHEPMRPRKLLLHAEEISSLIGKVRQKGYTLVPLELYWKSGRAKLQVGLAKGKKQHDKRAVEKDRDWQRDKARLLRASAVSLAPCGMGRR